MLNSLITFLAGVVIGVLFTTLPFYLACSKCERDEESAENVLGLSGDNEIEQAWIREVQDIFGIFQRKHHDYGRENIGLGGIVGLVVRMGDKMSRLYNLVVKGKQAKVSGEAVYDTLVDIADYAIIGLMLLHGTWPLFAPEDVWKKPQNMP